MGRLALQMTDDVVLAAIAITPFWIGNQIGRQRIRQLGKTAIEK